MRKTLFVCSSLLLVLNLIVPVNAVVTQESPTPAQQNQVTISSLQNEDVLKMTESGLSAEIIIAKIKVSVCKFDTTPATLQALKAANVPESVIMAMVQAPVGVSGNAVAALNDSDTRVDVKIPDGTSLVVQLMSTISSATAKEGDVVDFTIVSPVIVNGVMVIDKGAPAKARIASVKKAGYWGKAGRLGWTMQEVVLIDGHRTPLRMEKKLTGDSKGGTVATGAIITAVVFWPAAPFWGLKKGKNAVYPLGTRFEAFVHGDVVVSGKPIIALRTSTVDIQQNSQLVTPAKL